VRGLDISQAGIEGIIKVSAGGIGLSEFVVSSSTSTENLGDGDIERSRFGFSFRGHFCQRALVVSSGDSSERCGAFRRSQNNAIRRGFIVIVFGRSLDFSVGKVKSAVG